LEKRILDGLRGSYRLGELIERGQWSHVYRAAPLRPARRIPLEAWQIQVGDLHPHERREAVAHFSEEAVPYVALRHPSLARFVDFLIEGSSFYTIFEHAPGLRLCQILQRSDQAVEEDLILYLAAQGASALREVHRHGLVFGDLSPFSIHITREGAAFLTGYGLGRRLLPHSVDEPLWGTPGYAPPEQYGRNAVLTAAVDVYAFGVVLWEAMSMRDPVEQEMPLPSLAETGAAVSPWMDAFVRRCTALRPEDRYPDFESVLVALVERDPSLGRFQRGPSLLARVVDGLKGAFRIRTMERRLKVSGKSSPGSR